MSTKLWDPEKVEVVGIDACGACPWERNNFCQSPRAPEPVQPGGREIDSDVGEIPGWCPLRSRPDLIQLDLEEPVTLNDRIENLKDIDTEVCDILTAVGHGGLADRLHVNIWGLPGAKKRQSK